MSDSLIQFPAIARGASFAGTCLTHTMMFTGISFHQGLRNGSCVILSGAKNSKKPARFTENITLTRTRRRAGRRLLAGPALENQSSVGATKTKGVRQRIVHGNPSSDVGDIIQIALRVWALLVDGGRQNLVTERENADARLQAPGTAKQMPGHRLGGADGQRLARGALTDKTFHRRGFNDVANRG